MANQPRVSVYIPAYNCETFLPQTLDSVLHQTFEDWECIVVDDASPDSSHDIARAYAARDARFKVHRIAPQDKRPFPHVRNVAVNMATGRWIAPLDSDDLWDADKLQVQLDAIGDNAAIRWSYHGMRLLNNDVITIERMGDDPTFGHTNNILLSDRVVHSSTLICRQTLMQMGGYTPDMPRAQDWDLWLRLALRFGDMAVLGLPRVLGTYRVHGQNISSNVQRMHAAERKLMRRMILNRGLLVKKPVISMKMIDSQVLRELKRYQQGGLTRQARTAALLSALIAPYRAARWKLLTSI